MAERNELGLHRVDIPEGQGILFVKAPRPHLEHFEWLGSDPVRIEPHDTGLPWGQAVTNRVEKSFKRKLERQATWRLTEEEEATGLLRMRVRAQEPVVHHMGLPHVSAAPDATAVPVDKTTLVMELYDAESGEVLVQFIARRDLPRAQVGSRVDDDALRLYYSRFADSMGDSLQQLAQAVEDVRVDDERTAGDGPR